MKALSNRLGFALAGIATTVIGLGAIGCSSSNSDNPGSGGGTGGGGGGGAPAAGACTSNNLPVFFNPMYSAVIEGSTHTFSLPAVINAPVSAATVKWSASDPSMVTIDNNGSGALITMQKAGDVTITANAGGQCGSAPLHITAATEADWAAGNARYNNMNGLPMVPTDGGIPDPSKIMMLNPDPPDHPPACTNCHGDTATSSFFRTISHTPEQTGGFSDDDLIQIFTAAKVPPGGTFDPTIIPMFAWQFFHKWADISTPDAQKGMVVYLRSLPPKAQGGKVDFGNFMIPPPMNRGTGGTTATGAGGATTTGTGGKTTTGTGGATATGGASGTGGTKPATGGAAGAAGAAGGGGTAGAASGGTANGGGGTAGAGGN